MKPIDDTAEQLMGSPLTLEMAAPVSRLVEIKGILVAEAHIKREHNVDLDETGLILSSEVKSIKFHIDRKENAFHIEVEFLLHPSLNDEPENPPRVLMTAMYVLNYKMPSLDGITEENIKAFGAYNAVHNAWPYWREFVQSSSNRLGITTITPPVFRVG